MGSKVGEDITRDGGGTVVAETPRFVVFDCRERRTIGCLLTMGGKVGREDGRVVSCYNGYDEKSTTRFSLTEEAVEESVAVE
jgi:hypothetical protein